MSIFGSRFRQVDQDKTGHLEIEVNGINKGTTNFVIPHIEREEWVVRYFEILVAGFAAQPPPSAEVVPKRRGRQKRSAARSWLNQAGWSEKTIQDHVDNIRCFTRYLVLYAHSLCRLDEATDSEVYWFLAGTNSSERLLSSYFISLRR